MFLCTIGYYSCSILLVDSLLSVVCVHIDIIYLWTFLSHLCIIISLQVFLLAETYLLHFCGDGYISGVYHWVLFLIMLFPIQLVSMQLHLV